MKKNLKKPLFDISEFINVDTQQKIIYDLVQSFVERRKEQKISQKELSTRSGVSYGSIKRFEQTGDISLSSLIKISEAIDCLSDFKTLYQTPHLKTLKDNK